MVYKITQSVLFRPCLCPRTKRIGCSVAWTMRPLDMMHPLDDTYLRRCVLTSLWDRLTLRCDRPGRTVEEKPAIHYTNILWLAFHDQYLDGGSRVGKHRSGTRRPRDESPKGLVEQGTRPQYKQNIRDCSFSCT
jgi:hypothetical protein